MIVQHLSASFEHYTPVEVIEAARTVLGKIDLDPASCKQAQKLVKAGKWYGLPADGLAANWFGNVFLNPPGGTFTVRRKPRRDKNGKTLPQKGKPPPTPLRDVRHREEWQTDSRAVAWWRRMAGDYNRHYIDAGIFVGFNLDILQAAQINPIPGVPTPLEFPICIPRARLCFGGDQPTHGNVIIYLGRQKKRFEKVFSKIGMVKL